VYVDGLTGDIFSFAEIFLYLLIDLPAHVSAEPPADEIKQLMAAHGGGFTVFHSRTGVTHVIASNLCAAKIKTLGYVSHVPPCCLSLTVPEARSLCERNGSPTGAL
jgi:hypothetical protein